jgi:hypothetical protein
MQVPHNNICIVNEKDYLSTGYDNLVSKYQYVFAENDEGEIYPVVSRYEKRPISELFSNGFFGANVNVDSGLKALDVPRLVRLPVCCSSIEKPENEASEPQDQTKWYLAQDHYRTDTEKTSEPDWRSHLTPACNEKGERIPHSDQLIAKLREFYD